ncbi:3-hydroxyacyl-CoA dehydrogenase NAD-binding domain-containing protein [Sneathiella aquimaris]|uniref:3-hydroxyacyl-CoA dehydrogenase NAD-binding domain-containing protein n=1 Tax=Sneathiella aquimaris TaxID=2599305 RepID=UPI00146D3856|nr:3-hydroxyacyl-CoA dehydrogenase NAD-binding domain-containing protein [Sneathiella aquimaris]
MTAITDKVNYHAEGNVGVITINNPPVNALSVGVRAGIQGGIEAANKDDSVSSVVIVCDGRTFIAGADITEFGKPPQEPSLHQVIGSIEMSNKPVVAAIHGTALGGGLETALGCHYRVASPKAQVGLPEVKLGILPGAGGTQRLPRVVGIPMALEMITSGNPIKADKALEVGLVDEIADGDLKSTAIAFAEKVVAEGRPLIKISDRDEKLQAAKDNPGIFDDFRKSIARKARNFEAPENCIKAVQASTELPFPEGLKRERELFIELMEGEQSISQRYFFFAERQAAKIPDVPKDTPLIDINKVGIIGAGTMGGGIAMNFLQAGIPVTIVETTQEALDKGVALIEKNYAATVSKGRMSREAMDKCMSLLSPTTELEDVKDVDIVIEAIFENMDVKKELFAKLDGICKDGAILATNTSTLDVEEIGDVTERPEYVIGLHFFSPANVMKLLEEVRTTKTSKSVMATCMALAKRIGKVPAMVGVCEGFVGNRILHRRSEQATQLIMEGALPQDVDRVLFDFGMPMGPFAMSDLAGNDVGWRIRQGKGETSPIADAICELGRFGQKTGSGYYLYKEGSRTPTPDPVVEEIILKASADAGIERREISDQEILERCIYPMINEGAKILEEGIATRASDIDVIWVYGYGWPVYRGGPMRYAEAVGLETVYNSLVAYQEKFGDYFKPAALLERLVKEGKSFS